MIFPCMYLMSLSLLNKAKKKKDNVHNVHYLFSFALFNNDNGIRYMHGKMKMTCMEK